MSKFSKQEWLSTAKEFKVCVARVNDILNMIEFWCGKTKNKKAIDKHKELWHHCHQEIKPLLDGIQVSQYCDKYGKLKYHISEVPTVPRHGGDISIYIFYNDIDLPDDYEHYDISMKSKRPRPVLLNIPSYYSSIYLNDLEKLKKLIDKVLGEESYYRRKMSHRAIKSFDEFNKLLQECTEIIQRMTVD